MVSLIDYGFAGHLPYLVFAFLEGRTLEKRIAARSDKLRHEPTEVTSALERIR